MTLLQTLTSIFLLCGSFLIFAAGVGLLRLPDIYSRSHALGLGLCLGLTLMLLGLWLKLGIDKAGIKIPLIILFQFATIPVASHLLSLGSLRKRIPHSSKLLPPARSSAPPAASPEKPPTSRSAR